MNPSEVVSQTMTVRGLLMVCWKVLSAGGIIHLSLLLSCVVYSDCGDRHDGGQVRGTSVVIALIHAALKGNSPNSACTEGFWRCWVRRGYGSSVAPSAPRVCSQTSVFTVFGEGHSRLVQAKWSILIEMLHFS